MEEKCILQKFGVCQSKECNASVIFHMTLPYQLEDSIVVAVKELIDCQYVSHFRHVKLL